MLQQVMLMTEEACFFGDYKTQKTRLCLDWAKGQKKKKKKKEQKVNLSAGRNTKPLPPS